jgi:hypothetical protein
MGPMRVYYREDEHVHFNFIFIIYIWLPEFVELNILQK